MQTFVLQDLSRLAAEDGNLNLVSLEHKSTEHGACGCAIAVADYIEMSDPAISADKHP